MSIPRSLLFTFIIFNLSFNFTPESGAHQYIEKYRDLAIVEMYRSGIPASITLAQALHETNYGTSKLATVAKNHFGIKCKSNWVGQTYMHFDDDYDNRGNLIHSCFRSYDVDIDSYVDHSNFLMSRDRYNQLFQYSHTDYKKWAHGLKASGYATDPRYAEKLIAKVNRYGLDQYDHWENPLAK